jgi:hypothetical protein
VARRYVRDARGRFAGKGYSGQTAGRGARLMASGTRKGGGSRIRAGKAPGSFAAGGPKSPPANKIKRTGVNLASPAANNVRKLNVASKRNPLMTDSRARMKNRIKRVGRNLANLNRSIKTRESIQSAANRGGGYLSGREVKKYKKAERSASTAAKAFAFYQAPKNKIARSPRKPPGGQREPLRIRRR